MPKHLKPALALGLAAVAVGIPTAVAAAPLATWHGRYVWEENVGRQGGDRPGEGIVAFITYTLTLGPRAGATGCTLDGEGFQTDEQMTCTATPEGRSVVIKFYGMGPNGRSRYTIGTRLFTLTRTGGGLTTSLQALGPASDRTPRHGRLFRRLR